MPASTGSRKGIGGPKTPEGKRRVSLNALKHGLDAQSPQARELMAEAAGVEYEAILEKMRGYYQPADPVEDLLVTRIARSAWRLTITEAMEDRVLARRGIGSAPAPSQDRIVAHERRIDIQFHRAISALAEKRRRDAEKTGKQTPAAPPSSSVRPSGTEREFVTYRALLALYCTWQQREAPPPVADGGTRVDPGRDGVEPHIRRALRAV